MPEFMRDRATSDEQKEEVLRRLELVWKQFPAMRLGQLLVNVTGMNDVFYPEDYAIVRMAEEFAERNKRN